MILGIDYGVRNIGLAISEGSLATPSGTVKVRNTDQALKSLRTIAEKWSVSLVVIGISEGASKTQAQSFGRKLRTVLTLPVEFVDETLSTQEAQTGKRKDKDKEHSRAAAVILQRYLDSQKIC